MSKTSLPCVLIRLTPVLVALGSIPRKYEFMSNIVTLDLFIRTFIDNVETNTYGITFEAVNPIGLQKEIFVIQRADPLVANYDYSRVASLVDLASLGTSGITESREYRVDSVTIKSKSLNVIKSYKEGIPKVVKALLDDIKNNTLELIGKEETISLEGELDV